MTRGATAPWRLVVTDEKVTVHSRRGMMGPGHVRESEKWLLGLACGHVTKRPVRVVYRPAHPDWAKPVRRELPAPRKVRCEECLDDIVRRTAAAL